MWQHDLCRFPQPCAHPPVSSQDSAEEAELAAMEVAAAAETAAKAKAAQEARAAKGEESSSLFARAANFDAYLTTLILNLFDRPPLDALKQVGRAGF